MKIALILAAIAALFGVLAERGEGPDDPPAPEWVVWHARTWFPEENLTEKGYDPSNPADLLTALDSDDVLTSLAAALQLGLNGHDAAGEAILARLDQTTLEDPDFLPEGYLVALRLLGHPATRAAARARLDAVLSDDRDDLVREDPRIDGRIGVPLGLLIDLGDTSDYQMFRECALEGESGCFDRIMHYAEVDSTFRPEVADLLLEYTLQASEPDEIRSRMYMYTDLVGRDARLREVAREQRAQSTGAVRDVWGLALKPSQGPMNICMTSDSGGGPPKWRAATVWVDPDGLIVGGRDDGQPYTGTLTGTPGPDVILGTSGDDILVGLQGDDLLCGLDGNDDLSGAAGADSLYGGSGHDTLAGDNGADLLDGGDGDDTLGGGNDPDVLLGGPGADFLRGADGDDQLEGGPGDDHLVGNQGSDVLRGGNDDDELEGGGGDDTLVGDGGVDLARGGGGTDACEAETEQSCETEPDE